MKLSVIICTHNPREDYLRRTLAGLQAQSLPVEEWELIVVDNGSKSPVADGVDLSWHSQARHVREDNLGLTPARLRGIREAKGEVLVFVDDDTVLAPDYLRVALWVGAQWPFIGAWGGNVVPEFEAPLPVWVGDQAWRLTIVEVPEDVWGNLRTSFDTYPVGAGMCLRRGVAERYARQREQQKSLFTLDRSGTELTGYGDIDICQCAIDMGYGVGRSHKLRLTHLIPESRLTIDYFERHSEGDAASHIIFRALRGLPYQHMGRRSWVKSLIWQVSWLIHRQPWERQRMRAAYERGIRRGMAVARSIESARKEQAPC